MTWDECRDALSAYPRRVLVLATVAHVADRCVERCAKESLLAVVWALDATRRWALGETEMDEVRADADSAAAYAASAADSADSAASAAAYAASAAAYAASADSAAAYAAYAAYAADSAVAWRSRRLVGARQALVNSLRDAPTVEVDYVTTTTGHLVGRTHVWLREGACGGRWHRREQLAPEQLVALDTQLEAA